MIEDNLIWWYNLFWYEMFKIKLMFDMKPYKMIWNGNYDILKLNYEIEMKRLSIYMNDFKSINFWKRNLILKLFSKCLKYFGKWYMLFESIWTILKMYIGIFL